MLNQIKDKKVFFYLMLLFIFALNQGT